MYCRYCGSVLRENVKFCTHCGKPIDDGKITIISSETAEKLKEQTKNIGNKISESVKKIDTDKITERAKTVGNNIVESVKKIDTDKITDRAKTVSNNIVENVKNFDKDNAKQKTIDFTNTVKTDVKNFKTIPTKKKILYGTAILLIIVLLFNIFSVKTVKVTKSKNYYGMRFNIKISDFCKMYNKNFKQYTKELNAEPNSQLYLKEKHFEKQSMQNKQSGLDIYICTVDLQGVKTSFVLYTEPNSKKLVGVNLMADAYAYSNNEAYNLIIKKVFLASIVKTLDSSVNYPDQMYNSCTLANNSTYFKNNRLYNISENSISDTRDFVVMAMSDEKYRELYPELVN